MKHTEATEDSYSEYVMNSYKSVRGRQRQEKNKQEKLSKRMDK